MYGGTCLNDSKVSTRVRTYDLQYLVKVHSVSQPATRVQAHSRASESPTTCTSYLIPPIYYVPPTSHLHVLTVPPDHFDPFDHLQSSVHTTTDLYPPIPPFLLHPTTRMLSLPACLNATYNHIHPEVSVCRYSRVHVVCTCMRTVSPPTRRPTSYLLGIHRYAIGVPRAPHRQLIPVLRLAGLHGSGRWEAMALRGTLSTSICQPAPSDCPKKMSHVSEQPGHK